MVCGNRPHHLKPDCVDSFLSRVSRAADWGITRVKDSLSTLGGAGIGFS